MINASAGPLIRGNMERAGETYLSLYLSDIQRQGEREHNKLPVGVLCSRNAFEFVSLIIQKRLTES